MFFSRKWLVLRYETPIKRIKEERVSPYLLFFELFIVRVELELTLELELGFEFGLGLGMGLGLG